MLISSFYRHSSGSSRRVKLLSSGSMTPPIPLGSGSGAAPPLPPLGGGVALPSSSSWRSRGPAPLLLPAAVRPHTSLPVTARRLPPPDVALGSSLIRIPKLRQAPCGSVASASAPCLLSHRVRQHSPDSDPTFVLVPRPPSLPPASGAAPSPSCSLSSPPKSSIPNAVAKAAPPLNRSAIKK